MKTPKHLLFGLTVVLSMALGSLFVACATDDSDDLADARQDAAEDIRDADNPSEVTEARWDLQRREYTIRINSEIDTLETNIEALRERLDDDRVDNTLNDQIQKLELHKRSLELSLERLENTTEANWEEFKRDVDRIFLDVDRDVTVTVG